MKDWVNYALFLILLALTVIVIIATMGGEIKNAWH